MSKFCVCWIAISFFFVVLLLSTAGCSSGDQQPKTVLKVVLAGSLLQPFGEVEKSFEAEHPGVDVQLEGHGSIQAIRQVTDLHRTIDVVAVADESLVPDLMFRTDPTTGRNFTDSFTPFARNSMVIAYTGKSRYSGEISRENWYEILTRQGVRVGLSNPMLDAAGYRGLMVTMLAGEYYRNETIFPAVIGNHFSPPLDLINSGSVRTVELPEILRPSDMKLVVRDGSIYVLSLLESGGIDYAFEYRSVAQGHGLQWLDLPREIDLSSPENTGSYRNVSVSLGFQRFSAIGRDRKGQPIVYAITVPNSASHPELAREFIGRVLSMEQAGGKGWPAPL